MWTRSFDERLDGGGRTADRQGSRLPVLIHTVRIRFPQRENVARIVKTGFSLFGLAPAGSGRRGDTPFKLFSQRPWRISSANHCLRKQFNRTPCDRIQGNSLVGRPSGPLRLFPSGWRSFFHERFFRAARERGERESVTFGGCVNPLEAGLEGSSGVPMSRAEKIT